MTAGKGHKMILRQAQDERGEGKGCSFDRLRMCGRRDKNDKEEKHLMRFFDRLRMTGGENSAWLERLTAGHSRSLVVNSSSRNREHQPQVK